jgi:type IV secretion system protein VirB10
MGRPMLSAQDRGQAVPVPPVAGASAPADAPFPQADPAVRRGAQEREAARTSRLLSGGQSGGDQVQLPVELRSTAAASAPEDPTQPLGRGEAFLPATSIGAPSARTAFAPQPVLTCSRPAR